MMAMVERAEREVVAEFGVPLLGVRFLFTKGFWETYGASVGVSGLEGGSGKSMRVGVVMIAVY